MQDIAEHLQGTTKSMKVLELPGLGERTDKHGKDFSDWADIDGNDQKKLNEFISDAPEWSPLEVYDENLAVVEELFFCCDCFQNISFDFLNSSLSFR